MYTSKISCVGIDIDKSGIEYANKHFGNAAIFYQTDLPEMKVSEKFDVIIFRGTFQYLGEELHASMKQLKKLLKPDGKILVFTLPTSDSFVYYLLRENWPLFHAEQRLFFNERSVRQLMKMYSFQIMDLRYPYLEDAYSNPDQDYINIKKIILGQSTQSSPFWGGVMSLVITH